MSRSESPKLERIRKAYQFLTERQTADLPFTMAEIVAATGYAEASIRAHMTKKWTKLVKRDGTSFRAFGVAGHSFEVFTRLMSQRNDISADPSKPQLKPEIESLLRKARESALLALQIYNNPMTTFRTEGFSVMMVIAWTALFHAIFEKQGKAYYYVDTSSGKPKEVDGDLKAWELSECLARFYGGNTSPIAKNLEFFIRLRNKIEHRFVPEIDPVVAGHCQAALLNFDELLVSEFGTYFALRESLAVPLQTANVRPEASLSALKKLQARHFDEVNEFVASYQSALSPEVLGDQRFRFSVYLIAKPANHPGADHAIEYVRITPENKDEIAKLTTSIVAIRDRPVVNAGLLKAGTVVAQVASRLKRPFNMAHHTRAWRRYNVRRALKKGERVSCDGCNTKYCLPDAIHNDYLYTDAWVDFLVDRLAADKEYGELTFCRSPKRIG